MSKKECNTKYRKMAHAKAMTVAIPKVNRVSEIFKRKPYSSSNYVVHPSEKNRRADALMKTLGITDMDCVKCAWYSKAYRQCKRGGDFEDACTAIEDAPTIEPEWIDVDDYYNRISGRCSVCGWEAHMYEDDVVGMDYCPSCGADMRGTDNDA